MGPMTPIFTVFLMTIIWMLSNFQNLVPFHSQFPIFSVIYDNNPKKMLLKSIEAPVLA
jgi:hypothetical protein